MNKSLDVSRLISFLDKDFFSKDWLEVPPQEPYLEEAKEMIVLNIISAANEILKYYHLLFLSGEYVFGSVEEDFTTIDNYLKERGFEIDNLENEQLKLELQAKFQANLVYPFTRHIRPIITYFLRDLNIQLNFEYKRGIFRGDKVANSGDEMDEGVLDYIGSFKRLIKILGIEHFGNCLEDDLLRDFLVIRKEFEYFSINETIKNAIHVKVSFLLKKILYRRSLSNLDATVPEYIYSFDQQDDAVLGLDSIDIEDSLIEWDDLVKVHYGLINQFKAEQRKRRKEIEAKRHEDYSFKDYHGLIKIFKDDTKILIQAQNLLTSFNDRDKDALKFNHYSQVCTSAYIFNNCISLKCEDNSITVEEFNNLFSEIKNRQNLDDVRNYFPWLKLAQTMSDQIDNVSKQLSDPKKYKLFTELLDLFSKVIEKLQDAYSWSNYKKLIPMQLPFDECLSDYKIIVDNFAEVRLFFFSSFVLPLDYRSVMLEKNLLVSKKNSYKELLTVYDRLQYVVGEVADVSEKMRKQERRSVEILAIFSAMALFSVGSIQIFGNKNVIEDPNVYYKFIMSFGYSLALFVLLIWIITRDNIKKIQYYHWILILIILIGTCFAIGYFVGSPISTFIKELFS
ncbi:hypothetical protein [Sphingobacterium paucimobilis]|uniref:Uncharacterized protein n=1 Tax=Sphingobacterium paucimobilis HER1398 TaxID=1346330 RepID=U2I1E8_9SPHI|nr:hypothetical protein [Sphingobacterium paucimobilis]ERJ61345.1 hypothetical protein M472_21555 [Sphingobacterium paucimobilis HER1398]